MELDVDVRHSVILFSNGRFAGRHEFADAALASAFAHGFRAALGLTYHDDMCTAYILPEQVEAMTACENAFAIAEAYETVRP